MGSPDQNCDRALHAVVSPERANLRIRMRFEQKKLLEINEAVVVVEDRVTPLDYRYHCQDQQNHLISRSLLDRTL